MVGQMPRMDPISHTRHIRWAWKYWRMQGGTSQQVASPWNPSKLARITTSKHGLGQRGSTSDVASPTSFTAQRAKKAADLRNPQIERWPSQPHDSSLAEVLPDGLRQCLTPFKQTPRFGVWRVDRDTPIRTLNRHSRRLNGGVGASKRQPAVMPMYGDGCFVPRPQERDASFLSTQRRGARSHTPATFRNGWTAAHTRRVAKRELCHEREANVRARVRFFAYPLRGH